MEINHIDHIVLMVKNIKRTVKFYQKFLGKPLFTDKDSTAFQVGQTRLFLGLPYKNLKNNQFNKDRHGLNHLAFGVQSLKQLQNIEKLLKKERIKNSGIKSEQYSGKPFIWFDDPDGIRLEFYLRK